MQRFTGALRRFRDRRGDPDGGFTIIELMVALLVVFVAMVALAYALTVSLTDIAYASQRQSATGLANRAIEQVRALPYATVATGLNANDVANHASSDPNISKSNGNYYFGGEQIVTSSSSAAVAPLDPYIQGPTQIGPNSSTYTVHVYVTYYQGSTSSGVFRVTAVVDWTNPQRRGPNPEVQAQTVVFAPNGCVSRQTHPFGAPCQPFFYADAGVQGTGLAAGGVDGQPPLPGASNVATSTLLPTFQDAGMQLEQVQSVHASATTDGGTISYNDGTTSPATAGQQAAHAAASNDPTQPGLGPYQTQTAPGQASSPAVSPGSDASFAVTPASADTGSASATTAASTANSCTDISGTALTTNEPCSYSSTRLAGSSPAADVLNGPADVTFPMASVAAAPSAQVAATQFDAKPGAKTTVCPTAGGDGCVHAEASRALGTVQVGGMPPAGTPAGWSGYLVQVTGFSDSVSAESGVGTVTTGPSASVTGGTLSYWNGTGYATLSLGATSEALTIPDVSATDNGVTVTASATLSTGSTKTSTAPGSCTPACTLSSSATSSSPVTGDIIYTVTYGGSTVASVDLHVDLGTLSASTSYQPAPASG